MTKETNKQDEVVEETTERFYNTKSMLIAVGTAGVAGYLVGSKRGVKQGYIQGLKDGIVQGLAEGHLEGYVQAFSDVATAFRNAESE